MNPLKSLAASNPKQDNILERLNLVGKDKTHGIDNHSYKVDLRQSHVLVHFLALTYNTWLKSRIRMQGFNRVVIKLLRKDKQRGDGISNLQPLTFSNTGLEILVKVLLQIVFVNLIGQCSTTAAIEGTLTLE